MLKRLLVLLERRRAGLVDQAFVLGRSLYADAPAAFTSRMEGYWSAWAPETAGGPARVARGKDRGERRRPAGA